MQYASYIKATWTYNSIVIIRVNRIFPKQNTFTFAATIHRHRLGPMNEFPDTRKPLICLKTWDSNNTKRAHSLFPHGYRTVQPKILPNIQMFRGRGCTMRYAFSNRKG